MFILLKKNCAFSGRLIQRDNGRTSVLLGRAMNCLLKRMFMIATMSVLACPAAQADGILDRIFGFVTQQPESRAAPVPHASTLIRSTLHPHHHAAQQSDGPASLSEIEKYLSSPSFSQRFRASPETAQKETQEAIDYLIHHDQTLRRGDVLVTQNGVVVFDPDGGVGGAFLVANEKHVSKQQQKRLVGLLEIDQFLRIKCTRPSLAEWEMHRRLPRDQVRTISRTKNTDVRWPTDSICGGLFASGRSVLAEPGRHQASHQDFQDRLLTRSLRAFVVRNRPVGEAAQLLLRGHNVLDYNYPSWLIGLLFCGVFVGFTWVGIFLTRRTVHGWIHKEKRANEMVGVALSSFFVLFGLLLGLLAVVTYQNFSNVSDIVDKEAGRLTALYRDFNAYPQPTGVQLLDELREYTRFTIEEGWEEQRKGIAPKGGSERIAKMFATLVSFEPVKESGKIIHAETLREFNHKIELGRARLSNVTTGLPAVLWWVVAIGAVLNIVLIWMQDMEIHVHLILGAVLAAMLGAVVFLIAELDNPFRGEVAVGPELDRTGLPNGDKSCRHGDSA